MVMKIIVGCDGTWLNSDDGYLQTSYLPWAQGKSRGEVQTPSNVTRMIRALEPRTPSAATKEGQTSNRELQIVEYEPGIGSSNNWWDHFINGATAMSIGDNVSNAYMAIAEKFEPGDEIFLIGFSRGSFVARSVAAMIRFVGLLTKRGQENFYSIFQDWENQNVPGYKQKLYRSARFDDETEDDYCSYAKALEADGLTRLWVRIKAVAVWDTVGSLGIPTIGWRKPTRSYSFVNTAILSNVDYNFQALALDEPRTPFTPTLWEIPDSVLPSTNNTINGSTAGKHPPGVLRQCWFPGVHSNIGGSVRDAELPNIALAWMVFQLAPLLDFDRDYLAFSRQVNLEYYEKNKLPTRHWAMGLIKNPVTGIQVIGGTKSRTPGRYYRTDPETGQPLRQRLQNTHEIVHPAVRARRWDLKNGKGIDDVGVYDAIALKGFKLSNRKDGMVGTPAEGDPTTTGWFWKMEDPVSGDDIVLEEEVLGDTENMLLENQISTD